MSKVLAKPFDFKVSLVSTKPKICIILVTRRKLFLTIGFTMLTSSTDSILKDGIIQIHIHRLVLIICQRTSHNRLTSKRRLRSICVLLCYGQVICTFSRALCNGTSTNFLISAWSQIGKAPCIHSSWKSVECRACYRVCRDAVKQRMYWCIQRTFETLKTSNINVIFIASSQLDVWLYLDKPNCGLL